MTWHYDLPRQRVFDADYHLAFWYIDRCVHGWEMRQPRQCEFHMNLGRPWVKGHTPRRGHFEFVIG